MRPVTICRLGNSFIMVLATHGSQKEPQGGKRHQKVSTWGVRKARQKAIKIILITTPVYFHLKRGIQTPPSTADKGNRNHIFFQEKKKTTMWAQWQGNNLQHLVCTMRGQCRWVPHTAVSLLAGSSREGKHSAYRYREVSESFLVSSAY